MGPTKTFAWTHEMSVRGSTEKPKRQLEVRAQRGDLDGRYTFGSYYPEDGV